MAKARTAPTRGSFNAATNVASFTSFGFCRSSILSSPLATIVLLGSGLSCSKGSCFGPRPDYPQSCRLRLRVLHGNARSSCSILQLSERLLFFVQVPVPRQLLHYLSSLLLCSVDAVDGEMGIKDMFVVSAFFSGNICPSSCFGSGSVFAFKGL